MSTSIILGNASITEDGVYLLARSSGNAVVLAASNNFGGGTLKPGYINKRGDFVAFKDADEVEISFTASFQIVQDCGIGCPVAVELTGSTNPDIVIDQFANGR